jgi:predicted dehydrogenase
VREIGGRVVDRIGLALVGRGAIAQWHRMALANAYMASYAGELLDFARAIREGKPLAAGPEVAIGELRIAQAMERSAHSKRWEKVWA